MHLKYTIGSILSFPLLPIMYFQGKKIKASVPKLPQAVGNLGQCTIDNNADRSIRLLTIGESTIAGVGVVTHEEGFTGTLAKELANGFQTNVIWKVYARSGYTAKRVSQKIVPKITESKVDIVVVGLGGNDAFTLNSPKNWKRDVSELIANLKAKFPDAFIVFCNMPPIKEFPAFTPLIKFVIGNLVEILGHELEQLVKEYKNVFYRSEIITLGDWVERLELKADRSDFFSDGVHPSKLTYQTWAKDMALAIQNENAIKNGLLSA